MGLHIGPIYFWGRFAEHRHGQMVGAFFLSDVKCHLLVQWFPFFVLDHLCQDLLHQLGHTSPNKHHHI